MNEASKFVTPSTRLSPFNTCHVTSEVSPAGGLPLQRLKADVSAVELHVR